MGILSDLLRNVTGKDYSDFITHRGQILLEKNPSSGYLYRE